MMHELNYPGFPIEVPEINPIYLHATFAEFGVHPILQTVPQSFFINISTLP